MTLATLDTHAIVKDLRAAGFDEAQAEAVTRVVRQAQEVDLSALATKADLAITQAALQKDLADTKAGIQREISANKTEILKWLLGTVGIQTIATIGAVLALLHASGR